MSCRLSRRQFLGATASLPIAAGLGTLRTEAAESQRSNQLLTRWGSYRSKMQEGECVLQARNGTAAREAFTAALALMPGSDAAHSKLEICERRIAPSLTGFEIVGDELDALTARRGRCWRRLPARLEACTHRPGRGFLPG